MESVPSYVVHDLHIGQMSCHVVGDQQAVASQHVASLAAQRARPLGGEHPGERRLGVAQAALLLELRRPKADELHRRKVRHGSRSPARRSAFVICGKLRQDRRSQRRITAPVAGGDSDNKAIN